MSNILCQVLRSSRHVLKGNWPSFTYFKLLQIAFSLNCSAFEQNAFAAFLDDKGFCHSIRLKGLECPLYRLSFSEGDFACFINVTQNVSKFVSFHFTYFFFFAFLLLVERKLQKNRRSSRNASGICGKRCDLIKIEYPSLLYLWRSAFDRSYFFRFFFLFLSLSFTKSACDCIQHSQKRQR